MSIEQGNLNNIEELNPERGGWFVGKFIPESSLLHSEKCEVKWAHYNKGLKKDSGLNLDANSRTVVVLLSGVWKLLFTKENKEVVLSQPGDFIVFDGIEHTSEALEDCHVMVVRWYP